ncbi:hypothetical protein CJZ71_21385 [Bacillus subtilis]|uniref:hypothetical protein n=1 Tax=Bacillus subtilis TaxID=1423 RepID=UPI0008538A19|nr:hypothetical protein [Bacillus subtilis]AOS67842.1 hypothetical protein A4A60_09240 [Bacillus subtilis]ARW31420.1 uncharacterized protein S101441_01871 [Bacillus subtilis subsp. subtilis]ASV04479.1 hypothetical protein CJZ71_21385 [Bacillus subtilis]AYK70565.1 hypothetical protein D9C09_12815 [Bacillus subtilis subsp. subtilis]AYK74255.1 hypothetical protein D9C12_10615 [Bacillus subtilis subsp. subtilis]
MNIRNDVQKALQHLFGRTAVPQETSKVNEALNGEKRLLLGKVLRLLGDQHALIQVGNQTVQGKLETQLRPQAYYWFSYEKKTAEQTGRLQVVQSFDQNPKTIQDAAGKLLNAMSVKTSNAALMMTGAMLKSKTPVTENDIKTAVRWMDTLPSQDTKKAVETVLFALKRDLPIHSEILNGVHAVKSPVPLHQHVSQLLQAIDQNPQQSQMMSKLKEAVTVLLNSEIDVHAERLIDKLISLTDNTKAPSPANTAGSPGKASLPIANHTAEQGSIQEELVKTAADIPIKEARQLLVKLTESAEKNSLQIVKEAANWIKAAASSGDSKSLAASAVLQAAQVTDQEAEVFLKAVQQTAPHLADKADVLSFLSKVKTAIGARDEVAFIKAFEQGSAVTSGEMQSIKLALSALRASHEVAEPVKQEADQLFHKLNGQLFMQQDHPSYSQIVMSFPMFSKSGVQDMTVLFKGKKEADGKLDPSHCRLLFLLQLDTLKETVVDCLVQQKVMTITIETDFELQAAIDPMVPALKQGLKEMGYSLSGVNAKKRVHTEEKASIDQYITSISDQEVDVKI